MTVWICRAGLQGQYLNKFIDQKKVYLIGSVKMDLTGKTDMQELMKAIAKTYPTEPDGSVTTMSVQARAFATKAKVGDWVVVPDPKEKLLNIGEITGKYEYDGTKSELKHSHTVSWNHGVWKREQFTDDVLRSVDAFDSFMLFFKLGVEKKLKDIVAKGKPFSKIKAASEKPVEKPAEKPKKSVNKPEVEPLVESEPAAADPEIKEVINEVRETITYVKKETLSESAQVRKMLTEIQDIIAEVREAITEVKKATITQSTDVKKVIMEVRDALEEASSCCCDGEGEACGTKKIVYCNYDKWYYETPRERRRFRF